MRNLKVIMAYRGTNYHGYQIQTNALTVQEVVQKAVSEILNEKVIINGCSRTDTGVHANGYCFSVRTESKIPHINFIRGVNGKLPDDISILSCEDADEDFHARFSCKAKEYIYKIHMSESKNPFTSDLELHYRRPLDIKLMDRTAKRFIGTHDFKSFCSVDTKTEDTVRTIYNFDVVQKNENSVIMLVKGNGFLYNMVRIMVGTLIYVSEGRISENDIEKIITAKNRELAGKTAQPHGLYLNRVFY